jgi:hypothetical protein
MGGREAILNTDFDRSITSSHLLHHPAANPGLEWTRLRLNLATLRPGRGIAIGFPAHTGTIHRHEDKSQ